MTTQDAINFLFNDVFLHEVIEMYMIKGAEDKQVVFDSTKKVYTLKVIDEMLDTLGEEYGR